MTHSKLENDFVRPRRHCLDRKLRDVADLVFDISGRSVVGVDERGNINFGLDTANRVTVDLPQVLYADSKFEITKKISEELNKDSKKTVEPAPAK